MSLTHKLMLANLSISTFSGEKVDKNVSRDIAQQHHTSATKAGTYKKRIVGKSAVERIQSLATQARSCHYARTLPWSDDGPRLLSTMGFIPYTERMKAFQDQFHMAVEDFIRVYPDMIEEAKTRLNGMFNEADYPSITSLRQRFSFTIGMHPVSDGSNWLLDMADAETAEFLRMGQTQHFNASIEDAVKNVYGKIADVTEKMVQRLTATETDPDTGKVKGAIFRDSLVDNIRELADILPSLNVTEDPVLTELTSKMKTQLCKFDASALRAEPEFRMQTANAALAIFEQVKPYL